MDIKNFRKKYKLSNSDIIRIISYKYPKFNKYPLYMVSNQRDYGVQLVPGAEDALRDAVSRKKPNRTKSHQLTVRVDDNLFNALRFCCEIENKTTQNFIEDIIFTYCYGSRKKWQSMMEE